MGISGGVQTFGKMCHLSLEWVCGGRPGAPEYMKRLAHAICLWGYCRVYSEGQEEWVSSSQLSFGTLIKCIVQEGIVWLSHDGDVSSHGLLAFLIFPLHKYHTNYPERLPLCSWIFFLRACRWIMYVCWNIRWDERMTAQRRLPLVWLAPKVEYNFRTNRVRLHTLVACISKKEDPLLICFSFLCVDLLAWAHPVKWNWNNASPTQGIFSFAQ